MNCRKSNKQYLGQMFALIIIAHGKHTKPACKHLISYEIVRLPLFLSDGSASLHGWRLPGSHMWPPHIVYLLWWRPVALKWASGATHLALILSFVWLLPLSRNISPQPVKWSPDGSLTSFSVSPSALLSFLPPISSHFHFLIPPLCGWHITLILSVLPPLFSSSIPLPFFRGSFLP